MFFLCMHTYSEVAGFFNYMKQSISMNESAVPTKDYGKQFDLLTKQVYEKVFGTCQGIETNWGQRPGRVPIQAQNDG